MESDGVDLWVVTAEALGNLSGDGTPVLVLGKTDSNARLPAHAAILHRPVLIRRLEEACIQLTGVKRSKAGEQPAGNVNDPPVVADGHRRRVLVVEDNPVNQKLCLALLRPLGCETRVAANGREAVEQVRAGHSFDLVLMDCRMPEMDGLEATIALRQLEAGIRTTPIIALTAAAMDEDRARCFEAGMDDYLTKPIDSAALREKLALYLDGVR